MHSYLDLWRRLLKFKGLVTTQSLLPKAQASLGGPAAGKCSVGAWLQDPSPSHGMGHPIQTSCLQGDWLVVAGSQQGLAKGQCHGPVRFPIPHPGSAETAMAL